MKLDSIIENIETLAEHKDVNLVIQSLNGSAINCAELHSEGQKLIKVLKNSEIRISNDKSISKEEITLLITIPIIKTGIQSVFNEQYQAGLEKKLNVLQTCSYKNIIITLFKN
tara:strand:+ start:524 stop:862 length:339 start_codon:yes stop_codon:yes gene_type:complete